MSQQKYVCASGSEASRNLMSQGETCVHMGVMTELFHFARRVRRARSAAVHIAEHR